MQSRWRAQCAPIIARVLEETRGKSEPEIKRALRDAWPKSWGPRQYHPYKVWLDEIKKQRSTPRAIRTDAALAARIAEIEAHNRSVGT